MAQAPARFWAAMVLIRSAKPSGVGASSGRPPAVIVPSTRSEAVCGQVDGAIEVDTHELAVALDEAPGNQHVPDVGGIGLRDQAADGVGHRDHVQPASPDHDHVRLLARCQRADAVLEAHRVRAVGGAPAQRVAHGQIERLGHLVARVERVVAHAPLELQADSHLAEHVAGVGGHDVAGQARAHAELERAADDRVAHAHLDLGLRAR